MTAASSTLPAVLAGLIRERGPSLVGERRRLLGLLRDRLPGEVRAIRILMMAFDSGVPGRLSGTEPTPPEIGREGGLFAAETGLAPEVARQAVETWAVALCGYVPAGPITGGPRPQVRRLPPRQPPAAGSTTAAAAAAATGATAVTAPVRAGWKRRWPAIALGLVVVVGGAARLVYHPAAGPEPQQPAAPAAGPATPAPTPGSAATPEGYPIVSGDAPYPVFRTERIKGSANTLAVSFGVRVDGDPVSYSAAFAFDKGQRHGQGLVAAVQNGKKASTGVIGADRLVETGTGKSFLRVAGPMQQNAGGLPGLCAFAQVGDTLDRLDLVQNSLLAVFALDKDGGCDMQRRVGFGTLQ